MTGNLRQNIFFKEINLLAFFWKQTSQDPIGQAIKLPHSASNQIEPIHLFLFLPQPTAITEVTHKMQI
jgi:hypothetical protein